MNADRIAAVTAQRVGMARRALAAALPGLLTAALLLAGCWLAATGVDMLFGRGWALIAGAAPCLAAGAVLLRGLTRG